MEPSPERLGPFEILAPLGRGGMGVVYRARHRSTGELAAIKTVTLARTGRTRSITPRFRGLRREIAALGRLEHPGIVRILDHGVTAGLPWYAMELIGGTPLDLHALRFPVHQALVSGGLARPAGTWWTHTCTVDELDDPEPSADEPATAPEVAPDLARAVSLDSLRPLLEVVRHLCETLAYLHGEGLVHRDLKPDNVLVRPDGWPVIVDFGLTASFGGASGREALQTETGAAGTLDYMSPEQIRGELVDARADLYALGCMMYQLVTGAAPFTGASGTSLNDHLHRAPIPPAEKVPGIPPPLEELILGLLRKEPRHRIGYASSVATALEELAVRPRSPEPLPPPRTYVYRAHLAGQQALLDRLDTAFDATVTDGGRVILLGGEAGVGKTRLAIELARQAGKKGALVLGGECPPGAGEALGLLRRPLQTVADLCRQEGTALTAQVFGAGDTSLVLYEPSVEGLPGIEPPADWSALSAAAARARLYTELTDAFHGLCRRGPVVLVLDDLQWADGLALGWLTFVARSPLLADMALLILGLHRTDEPHPALEALGGDRVTPIDVQRLDRDGLGEMLADMLAVAEAPAPLVDFLHARSEGNPYYTSEFLHAAIGAGVVTRDPAGRWRLHDGHLHRTRAELEALGLPTALHELLLRRLVGLSTLARQVVGAAAVIGREVDPGLLEAVCTDEGLDVDTATAELVSEGVLEWPGDGLLRFAHTQLQQVASDDVAPERRRALHLAAARALEAAAPESPPAARLARHYELAGEPDTALPHYVVAAQQAVERYAWDQAERAWRSAMRLSTSDAQRLVRWTTLIVDVIAARGDFREADAECDEAITLAREVGHPPHVARLLKLRGAYARAVGRNDLALAYTLEAVEVARTFGLHLAEADARLSLATGLHQAGRLEDSERELLTALHLIRGQDQPKLRGLMLSELAWLEMHRGHTDRAVQLYLGAIACHEEAGDPRTRYAAVGNLAAIFAQIGQLQRAEQLIHQTLEHARQIRDLRSESLALGNLGTLYAAEGRLAEGEPHLTRAVEVLSRLGQVSNEVVMSIGLATLLADLGKLDRADTLYARTFDRLEEAGQGARRAFLQLNWADLCIVRRDLERARALLDAVGAEIGDPATVEFGSAWVHALGLLALREGRHEDARRHLLEALDLAQRIDFPTHQLDALVTLAELCVLEGQDDDAAAYLGTVDAILSLHDVLPARVQARCLRARLAVRRGEDPSPELAEARAVIDRMGAGPRSRVRRALAEAEAAVGDASHPPDVR